MNKIDQIRNETDRTKIVDFVEKNARQVLEEKSIRIFPISALNRAGFDDLETFLRLELNDKTKLKLKLENPLGIVERIFDENVVELKKREEILREDEKVKVTMEHFAMRLEKLLSGRRRYLNFNMSKIIIPMKQNRKNRLRMFPSHCFSFPKKRFKS